MIGLGLAPIDYKRQVGRDGVVFFSRELSLREWERKEKVLDTITTVLGSTSPGCGGGVMRRARSPRRLEYSMRDSEPPRCFPTNKRLAHVLLSLLGRQLLVPEAPSVGPPPLELSPPLEERVDDDSEVVIDAATIDAVCRAEFAAGRVDEVFVASMRTTPDGPRAVDIYGQGSFRISIREVKRLSQSMRRVTGSPLPPHFFQGLSSFLTRRSWSHVFWLWRTVPLLEFGCEQRWGHLVRSHSDELAMLNRRLGCLEKEYRAISDRDKAVELAMRRVAITALKGRIAVAEQGVNTLRQVALIRAVARQLAEWLSEVLASPESFGFRSRAHAEAACNRTLNHLSESVCLFHEAYSMVDGCNHRYNQLTGKTVVPFYVASVTGISEVVAPLDASTLRVRLRAQYRMILTGCQHHAVRHVVCPLELGPSVPTVSEASHREASLRALLDVLSEDSCSLQSWYIQTPHREEVEKHLDAFLSPGGPCNDPQASRFLRCSMVVFDRDAKFLVVEMAKRATSAALVVASDVYTVLMGATGGSWEKGRESAFGVSEDIACTTTSLLANTEIGGTRSCQASRVLFTDTEGWSTQTFFAPSPVPLTPAVSRTSSPIRARNTSYDPSALTPHLHPLGSSDTIGNGAAHGVGTALSNTHGGLASTMSTLAISGYHAASPAVNSPLTTSTTPASVGGDVLVSLVCGDESCILEVNGFPDVVSSARETFELDPTATIVFTYQFQGRSRLVRTEQHFRTYLKLLASSAEMPELHVQLRNTPSPAIAWCTNGVATPRELLLSPHPPSADPQPHSPRTRPSTPVAQTTADHPAPSPSTVSRILLDSKSSPEDGGAVAPRSIQSACPAPTPATPPPDRSDTSPPAPPDRSDTPPEVDLPHTEEQEEAPNGEGGDEGPDIALPPDPHPELSPSEEQPAPPATDSPQPAQKRVSRIPELDRCKQRLAELEREQQVAEILRSQPSAQTHTESSPAPKKPKRSRRVPPSDHLVFNFAANPPILKFIGQASPTLMDRLADQLTFLLYPHRRKRKQELRFREILSDPPYWELAIRRAHYDYTAQSAMFLIILETLEEDGWVLDDTCSCTCDVRLPQSRMWDVSDTPTVATDFYKFFFHRPKASHPVPPPRQPPPTSTELLADRNTDTNWGSIDIEVAQSAVPCPEGRYRKPPRPNPTLGDGERKGDKDRTQGERSCQPGKGPEDPPEERVIPVPPPEVGKAVPKTQHRRGRRIDARKGRLKVVRVSSKKRRRERAAASASAEGSGVPADVGKGQCGGPLSAPPTPAEPTPSSAMAGTPRDPTPSDTARNSAPSGTPRDPTPSGTPRDPTPSDTARNSAPSGTPRDPTPSGTPRDPTPSGTPRDPTPSGTPRDPTPSGTPRDPTPSGTPRDPTPSGTPRDPVPSDTAREPVMDGRRECAPRTPSEVSPSPYLSPNVAPREGAVTPVSPRNHSPALSPRDDDSSFTICDESSSAA